MLDFEKWNLAVETRNKILSRNSEQDISNDINEATRSIENNGMRIEFEKYLSSILLTLLISGNFPSIGRPDEEMKENCEIARRILKWEV